MAFTRATLGEDYAYPCKVWSVKWGVDIQTWFNLHSVCMSGECGRHYPNRLCTSQLTSSSAYTEITHKCHIWSTCTSVDMETSGSYFCLLPDINIYLDNYNWSNFYSRLNTLSFCIHRRNSKCRNDSLLSQDGGCMSNKLPIDGWESQLTLTGIATSFCKLCFLSTFTPHKHLQLKLSMTVNFRYVQV